MPKNATGAAWCRTPGDQELYATGKSVSLETNEPVLTPGRSLFCDGLIHMEFLGHALECFSVGAPLLGCVLAWWFWTAAGKNVLVPSFLAPHRHPAWTDPCYREHCLRRIRLGVLESIP